MTGIFLNFSAKLDSDPKQPLKDGQVKLDTDPTSMEANVGSGAGALLALPEGIGGKTFLRTFFFWDL